MHASFPANAGRGHHLCRDRWLRHATAGWLWCIDCGCPAAPRAQQRCDTNGAQWAVGKTNTEHNVNEARKRAGAYMARVLRPGQVTTREFNAERLNLEVDATGRIIAARCG